MILDDRLAVLGAFSSVCSFCRHWQLRHKCAAFEVIPEEIWLGKNDHRQPYPGDNGIQFEPIDAADDEGSEVG